MRGGGGTDIAASTLQYMRLLIVIILSALLCSCGDWRRCVNGEDIRPTTQPCER